MEFSQGARLADRFKVIGCLGTGHDGQVFLAKDGASHDGLVALKVFHEGALSSMASRIQLAHGVKVLSQLDCDVLVRPFEYVDEGSFKALSMEYVEGRDLGSLLEEEDVSTERIIGLLRSLAGELDKIHSRGMVHNEITPSHILLTKDGKIKLCGCPQKIGDNEKRASSRGLRVGTAHYKPPEYLSAGVLDSRNDIYALGVLASELYRGSARGKRRRGTLQTRTDGAMGEEFLRIIDQAMAANPDDRYQTAKEMEEALERLALGIQTVRLNASWFIALCFMYVSCVLGVFFALARYFLFMK